MRRPRARAAAAWEIYHALSNHWRDIDPRTGVGSRRICPNRSELRPTTRDCKYEHAGTASGLVQKQRNLQAVPGQRYIFERAECLPRLPIAVLVSLLKLAQHSGQLEGGQLSRFGAGVVSGEVLCVV